jgi:hypothetical protein
LPEQQALGALPVPTAKRQQADRTSVEATALLVKM